jgi:hypothetical protein
MNEYIKISSGRQPQQKTPEAAGKPQRGRRIETGGERQNATMNDCILPRKAAPDKRATHDAAT